MYLTDEMLQAAAADANTTAETLTAFTFTNKEVDDISTIRRLQAVEELNLSFNSIASLKHLESLPNLKLLNVMHNNIMNLSGMGHKHLTVLKISNNKLKSVEDLRKCPSLEEVWLQQNTIGDLLKAVNCLSELPCLKRLVFNPNPCSRQEPQEFYKSLVMSRLPCLEMLDAMPVDEAARKSALMYMQTTEASSLLKSLQEKSDKMSTASPQRGKIGRGGRTTPSGGRTTPTDMNEGRRGGGVGRGSRPPSSTSMSPNRPPSNGARYGRRARNTERDNGSQQPVHFSRRSPSPGGFGRPISGRSTPSYNSDVSSGSSLGYYEDSEETSSERGDGEVSIMGAVDSLPQFTSQQRRKGRPPVGRSGGSQSGAKPKREMVSSPLPPIESDWSLNYQDGTQAIVVRADGSAFCRWPNKNLAVSVDPESGGYRLYATYFRSGSIAASFDHTGNGYVNFPSGSTFFSHNANSGGFVLNSKGELVQEWRVNKNGKCTLGSTVEMQLDQHLSFRFTPENQAYIFFSCNGANYRFVWGFNAQEETWTEEETVFEQASLPQRRKPPPTVKPVESVADIRHAVAGLDGLSELLSKLGSGGGE